MRLSGRVANLEHYAANARSAGGYAGVVIYDAETGRPLPGHEPNPQRSGVSIWIPDNGRGAAYGEDDAE